MLFAFERDHIFWFEVCKTWIVIRRFNNWMPLRGWRIGLIMYLGRSLRLQLIVCLQFLYHVLYTSSTGIDVWQTAKNWIEHFPGYHCSWLMANVVLSPVISFMGQIMISSSGRNCGVSSLPFCENLQNSFMHGNYCPKIYRHCVTLEWYFHIQRIGLGATKFAYPYLCRH